MQESSQSRDTSMNASVSVFEFSALPVSLCIVFDRSKAKEDRETLNSSARVLLFGLRI